MSSEGFIIYDYVKKNKKKRETECKWDKCKRKGKESTGFNCLFFFLLFMLWMNQVSMSQTKTGRVLKSFKVGVKSEVFFWFFKIFVEDFEFLWKF